MSTILSDLRFSVRSLLQSPLFTFTALLSLALGIGANTAIFTLLDQVLLRSLPVLEPEHLVMIASRGSHVGSNRGSNAISYPMFQDYREENEVFEGVICRHSSAVTLVVQAQAERATGELVSGNYFQVLGVQAAAGRLFSMEDETGRGENPVVVLNYDFWQRRFGGSTSIINQKILVNNYPMTVVGVAESGFQGVTLGEVPDIHIPVTMEPQVIPPLDDLEDRRTRWLQVFARLKPGVSREQAEASINVLFKQIIQEEVQEPYFKDIAPYYREQFLQSHAIVIPGGQGYSNLRRQMEQPMLILMGLVGLVLLIACANVSNLMVARGAARRREISIRRALGAGRWRIVQQVLDESALLAFLGALLGLAVSYGATRVILLLAPDDQARMAISPNADGRILLFSIAVAGVAALLFGLLPALQLSRGDVFAALKEESSSVSGGQGVRLRKALVVIQVSLSLALLAGSSLFLQSLRNLQRVDPGFEATNLIRFKINPLLSGYDVPGAKAFFRELQGRVEGLPGVRSAGLAVVPIMEGDEWDSTISVEGYAAALDENMNPHFNAVSPRYFKTLGIDFVAGEDFSDQVGREGRTAAIVNQTFVRSYFRDRNPIGYHIGFGRGPNTELNIEIVGVIRDSKYEDLRQEVPRQIFVPYQQNNWATEMTCYVRTTLPSDQMFSAIRQELKAINPMIPLYDMNTMQDQLDRSLSLQRLVGFLSICFALLATLLALVGLYGVTSYGVLRRMREISIRIALGAGRRRVVKMVLLEVALLVGAGIAVGLPVTWWSAGLVRNQLYGIEARDPLSLGLSMAALVIVALLAGAIPAWRAARTNPARVLRCQ